MKKILILANNDIGLYKFRKELIAELLNQGNQVHISVPDGDFVKPLVQMGCKFHDTRIDRRGMNPIKDFGLFRNYLKLTKRIKPDLIITYTIKPNIYGGIVCALKNIKYTINITGLGTTFQNENFIKRMVTILYKIACCKAKVVFFENAENQEIFIQNKIIERDRTVKLNGAGVNLDEFPFTEYPVDDGTTRFLFVGRIMKEKGIDEFLEAAERIKAEYHNVYFDLVGPMEDKYEQKIEDFQDREIIRYHGYQSDVRPFIAHCHCFVLPSYHEGMANTLLEAGAMGRPLIASDISGCRESIVEGINGYLVPARNSDSLFHILCVFITLRYEIKTFLGSESYELVRGNFDRNLIINSVIWRLK